MLKIIAGKPGTGKTYYMMSTLVDMLADWVRFERKNNAPFESSIWTNIKVNEEGLNKTIASRLGVPEPDVDAGKYVRYLDDSFFHDPQCVYWWQKFPPKSFIVIDEVHHYLGKKIEYADLDMEEALINYLSMHRHSQQDLYFLSQHTDNFASQILGIADTLLEIVNAKNVHLPFPISIPLEDFDTVKQSFGVLTQYYQVNIGTYRGKAVKWTGASTRHLMTEEIFRVYKSHTRSDDASDRPSLKMSPVESLLWFSRRHAWHIVPKLLLVYAAFAGVWYGLPQLPHFLNSALVGKDADLPKTADKPVSVTAATPETASDPLDVDNYRSAIEVSNRIAEHQSRRIAELEKSLADLSAKRSAESSVVGLFPGLVVTQSGKRIFVGEWLDYADKPRRLVGVDPSRGTVELDGREIVRF